MRCSAITRSGGRCKLDATHGDYCWSHAPEFAEERKRRAGRGGRSGGNGRPGVSEITTIKQEIRAVIAGVLDESLGRGAAAVAIQGYNALTRVIELERKVRELDEVAERLEQLEQELESTGGRRYGHR